MCAECNTSIGESLRIHEQNDRECTKVSWVRPSCTAQVSEQEQWARVQNALDRHQKLQDGLTSLLHKTKTVEPAAVHTEVQALVTEAAGLDTFFRDLLLPVFYNTRVIGSQEGCAPSVKRVFDVPELMEHILENLLVKDILSFQQADRTAYDTIEGSPRLQSLLSLRPDAQGSPVRQPFVVNHQLPLVVTCRIRRAHRSEEVGPEVKLAVVNASLRRHPHPPSLLGSRYRRMFIIQPPIKQMDVQVECCHEGHKTVIKSETGLTVGDLFDMTKKMEADHRMCPHAPAWFHDEEGYVKAHVDFSATIQLHPEDPMAERDAKIAQRQQERRKVSRRAGTDEQNLMNAYCNYKVQAHDNGEPILTLKEFKETHTPFDFMHQSTNTSMSTPMSNILGPAGSGLSSTFSTVVSSNPNAPALQHSAMVQQASQFYPVVHDYGEDDDDEYDGNEESDDEDLVEEYVDVEYGDEQD